MSLTHDNKYACAGCYAGKLHIYDINEKTKIYEGEPLGVMIYDIAVSLDNKYLILGGNSPNICIFDL